MKTIKELLEAGQAVIAQREENRLLLAKCLEAEAQEHWNKLLDAVDNAYGGEIGATVDDARPTDFTRETKVQWIKLRPFGKAWIEAKFYYSDRLWKPDCNAVTPQRFTVYMAFGTAAASDEVHGIGTSALMLESLEEAVAYCHKAGEDWAAVAKIIAQRTAARNEDLKDCPF